MLLSVRLSVFFFFFWFTLGRAVLNFVSRETIEQIARHESIHIKQCHYTNEWVGLISSSGVPRDTFLHKKLKASEKYGLLNRKQLAGWCHCHSPVWRSIYRREQISCCSSTPRLFRRWQAAELFFPPLKMCAISSLVIAVRHEAPKKNIMFYFTLQIDSLNKKNHATRVVDTQYKLSKKKIANLEAHFVCVGS